MTKAFTSLEKWQSLLQIAQIFPGVTSPSAPPQVAVVARFFEKEPSALVSTAIAGVMMCKECGFGVSPGAPCMCDWD